MFDTRGYRISELKNRANKLCPQIKATDRDQSFICAPAHMNIATLAQRSQQPVIEECDAGMLKLVVPIIVNDVHVGAFGACGFRLDDGEIDSFLINKMTDISEDKIGRLAADIANISTAKAKDLGQHILNQIKRITTAEKQPP